MTLVPLDAINQLLTPLRGPFGNPPKNGLQKAESDLINYLRGISQPSDAIPTNLGEEDVIVALQELQQAPTEYVVQVLSKPVQPTKPLNQNDVLVAVNLVQTYLQITSTLDGILTTLAEIDSTNQQKYQDVKDARNALAKALVIIQAEPGLADGEIDVEVLRQESQKILESLKPFVTDKFIDTSEFDQIVRIVSQFVNHLERARSIFKTLSSEDLPVSPLQIPDIQELVQNWETITGNLKTITANESQPEVQTSRASIAQSVQIHSQLEAIYDYLAEILRSNDLFNPAIL